MFGLRPLVVFAVIAAALVAPTAAAAQAPDCPCTVFAQTTVPDEDARQDQPLEVGMRFRSSEDGFITALRFYKHSSNTGRHVGHLWSASGQQLAEVEFTDESASGWQVEQLPVPVAITQDTAYVASYHSASGHYSGSPRYFSEEVGQGPLRAPALGNGVYRYGPSAFPDQTFDATNYWVDATFERTLPADNRPPRIAAVTPADGARDVAVTTALTATFDEPVDPETITSSTFSLRDPDDNAVAAAVAYEAGARTATLTPAAELPYGKQYTATIKGGIGGVTDAAGNPLPADRSWSLTTPAACPCTVFGSSETPMGDADEGPPAELGMKLSSSEDGFITALRFYKPAGDTGRHVGHLWSSDGDKLAEVEFSDESPAGWQVEQLPVPIAITTNTRYVASYHSSGGRYAYTANYFSSDIGDGPLQAPALGNGVYRYGQSAFPEQSFNATNYWVDATFERTRPADSRPPRVIALDPERDANSSELPTRITAMLDEPVDAVTARPDALVLENDAGDRVAGDISYEQATHRLTFTPSARLEYGTTYRATVKGGSGGVADLAGNPLEQDLSWTFSTPGRCPCTIFAATDGPTSTSAAHDSEPIEVGVKFRSGEDGVITALRFYKQPNNTGSHVGHLWSSDGQLLATAPYVDETTSGWQQAQLPDPIAVTKDTTYVASYHSESGYFAIEQGGLSEGRTRLPLTAPASGLVGGNGVYRYGANGFPDQTNDAPNYWVDATFERVAAPTAAPEAVQIPEIWGAPMVGERLEARRGRWRSDTPLEWEYDWLRCDAAGEQCAATGSGDSGHSAFDLDASHLGSTLRVRVTARNASGERSAMSEATPPIRDTDPPEADAPPRIETHPEPDLALVRGLTLTADSTDSRWYPRLGSDVEWQWQRCEPSGDQCAAIEGAAQASYTLTAADEGATLRVSVTVANRGGAAHATSAPTEVVRGLTAPRLVKPLEPPALDDDDVRRPWEGYRLRADAGMWGRLAGQLGDNDVTSGRTYQWLRCDAEGDACEEIADATNRLYESATADVGHRLRARVGVTNAEGQAAAVSPPSEEVLPVGTPIIDSISFGHERIFVENLLYAGVVQNADAGPSPDRTYQWKRCDAVGEACIDIEGATDGTYTPKAEDLGARLRLRVTLTNRVGSSTATSDASPVIEPAPTPDVVNEPTVTPSVFGTPTVSDHPQVGVAVFGGTDGVWGPDLAYSLRRYRWQRCSEDGLTCEDIAGTVSQTNSAYYTPRRRDAGHRLRFHVTAVGGHGEAWATSAMTAVVDPSGPMSLSRPAVEGPPRVREYLRATIGTWDPEISWADVQWLRCAADGTSCLPIPGADWSEYLTTEEDRGSALRVRVRATTEFGSTAVLSPPTDPLGPPAAPEKAEDPFVDGDAVVGATLYGIEGQWLGAQPLEFDTHWLRCDLDGDDCNRIVGATDWEYHPSAEDIGTTLRFEVTASNGLGTATATSAASPPVTLPDPPAVEVAPSIEGDAATGETLTARPGEWSNYPTVFEYQWQRCEADGGACIDVDGATEDSYHLPQADEGSRLQVVVTAANEGGESAATSEPTDVIGPMAPPENLWEPDLWGSVRESVEVTPDDGGWDGGTPLSFDYQWQRCDDDGETCVDIAGAQSRGYTPVAEDVGHTLRIRMRATNEAGSDEAISRPSRIVARSAPRFVERVTIAGELREGVELHAVTDGVRGSQPIALAYTWLRCEAHCSPIPGATVGTYTAQDPDVAARLRVKVVAENDEGTAGSTSIVSEPIEPAEVEAEPVAASRPALSGLPRVTETVTSTLGTWRGAAPIATSIRWQRCGTSGDSCEDIPGATEATYTLVAADAGMRLRTVVTAENAVGATTASSIISPPMRPEFNTAFSLDGAASLTDVADAIRAAGSPAWISFTYGGERTGVYDAGAGATVDHVLAKFSGVQSSSLHVTSFTVAGDVEISELGALGDQIDGRLKVPAIRLEQTPQTPQPAAAALAAPTDPLDDVVLEYAMLNAWGWPCGDVHDCPDDLDSADWETVNLPVPRHPEYPRIIETSFKWRHSPAYFEERTAREDRFFAWENDIKLHNPDSSGLPGGLACVPWESNDFWVANRDDEDKLLESNIPEEAGLYWDIPTSDDCSVKDLSYGIYHPERLQLGGWYYVDIFLSKGGDRATSTFNWASQLLERHPPISGPGSPGHDCDFSRWCVNVPPHDDVHEGETFINAEWGVVLPNCREYDVSYGLDHARPCAYPMLAAGR